MLLLSQRIDYGMRLRAERTGQSVNFADCARAAGVSAAAMSLWRKDENGMNAKYARPLAEYFGVDPLWLETGIGYPDREKNVRASLQSEKLVADQLALLIRHFFAATPTGRDQLLDFAAEGIEKMNAANIVALQDS